MNLIENLKNIFRVCSLSDIMAKFKDNKTCIKALERALWEGVPVSPFDATSKVYRCANGRYRCSNTGKYFNVLTGTIFESTKLPLSKWFLAIYFISCHKKGISSMQLARDIGVTQTTAWYMLSKIRRCLACENNNVLSGEVELDETFVGGKNKNRHKDKKVKNSQGRSFKDKVPIQGLLQRDGKLTAIVVKNTSASSLLPNILQYVKKGSTLYTDEWHAYDKVGKEYNRLFVDHSKKQYADGNINTNSLEGTWTMFKRSINGTYHKVSREHLQQYTNEFTYRRNVRDMSVIENFFWALINCNIRVTYNDIRYGQRFEYGY